MAPAVDVPEFGFIHVSGSDLSAIPAGHASIGALVGHRASAMSGR